MTPNWGILCINRKRRSTRRAKREMKNTKKKGERGTLLPSQKLKMKMPAPSATSPSQTTLFRSLKVLIIMSVFQVNLSFHLLFLIWIITSVVFPPIFEHLGHNLCNFSMMVVDLFSSQRSEVLIPCTIRDLQIYLQRERCHCSSKWVALSLQTLQISLSRNFEASKIIFEYLIKLLFSDFQGLELEKQ